MSCQKKNGRANLISAHGFTKVTVVSVETNPGKPLWQGFTRTGVPIQGHDAYALI